MSKATKIDDNMYFVEIAELEKCAYGKEISYGINMVLNIQS